MSISELIKGSWIMGILVIVFGLIGLFNAFSALILWFKKFTEWLERMDRKGKSKFLLWIIVIVISLGWYALFDLIKLF